MSALKNSFFYFFIIFFRFITGAGLIISNATASDTNEHGNCLEAKTYQYHSVNISGAFESATINRSDDANRGSFERQGYTCTIVPFNRYRCTRFLSADRVERLYPNLVSDTVYKIETNYGNDAIEVPKALPSGSVHVDNRSLTEVNYVAEAVVFDKATHRITYRNSKSGRSSVKKIIFSKSNKSKKFEFILGCPSSFNNTTTVLKKNVVKNRSLRTFGVHSHYLSLVSFVNFQ